jgi:choloylglycine hydrolase
MCTDLRLTRLDAYKVSARTLDFAFETQSKVEIVPRGQQWTATQCADGGAIEWSNSLGFVALSFFGFDNYFADGLNEAGLSVATLWLPETRLPTAPVQGSQPAIDFINLAGWLLGTCATVAEVKAALMSVRIWDAPVSMLWPQGRPMPEALKPLTHWTATEHLSIHDAQGNDLVVEFVDEQTRIYDNHVGVLTNSPEYPWHVTNLRNYIGLTNVEDKPYNLLGMPVVATGNGTGLLGMPGDVTPPSRFVRATVLTQVVQDAADARDAVNQAFHSLDLVSVPRSLAASGDYTQWYVARDHANKVLYVRSYESWHTDRHDLAALGVDREGQRSTAPLPSA